jgi:predicted outer membrane repeat protein
MKASSLTSIIVCSLIFCAPALSNIIYVDDDAPGTNNGTNWTNAYTDLQSALSIAISGDQIRVAQGTYKPTAGTDRTVSFQLKNNVELYGGYAGIAEPTPDDRNVELYESVLSGDIGFLADNSDNSYHVLYHPSGTNLNATALLDGFTITAGNASVHDSTGNSCGGGMYNENLSSPTINNCTFTDNDAYWGGGGMYNKNNSSPTVTNSTFEDNYAYQWSGGMFNEDTSSPTVTNCDFTDNLSSHGAAMCNRDSSNTTVTDCLFTNNAATSYGGAIDNYKSAPTITNCMFTTNTAGFRGGAMFNWESEPAITNCTFTGNITESVAGGAGGAMENYDRSSPTIINCTFADNYAEYRGGGIYNNDNCGSTVINCILWGNSNLQIDNDDTSSAVVTYSDVQGGYPGTGNINANPLFVNAAGGNYLPQYTSLCIDTGDNNAVPVGVTTDLDGLARIVDGDCDGIATVDMGAYELDWLYLGDFDGDCDVDFADFAILSANWLQNNPAIDIVPLANPDGIIDSNELMVLIDNWLAGT